MGEYFEFINKTRDEKSTIPLPFNFGLPWCKNIHEDSYSDDQRYNFFLFVIENNNWSENDIIYAAGDYGTEIYFEKIK